MHVQLVTRKAALPFDPDHDLICDVYDSLFTLFTETRALLLDLPPREFERTSGVATLILKVQNDGVRPHLTAWQAPSADGGCGPNAWTATRNDHRKRSSATIRDIRNWLLISRRRTSNCGSMPTNCCA